jgi:Protein of unknown function (DUF3592)
LAGVALVGFGVYRETLESKFLAKAAKALGTVTEIQTTPLDEQTNTYCAVVTFDPAKGKAATFVNGACATSQLQRIGDKVPVLYDPDEPTNGRIAQHVGPWAFALPFFAWAILSWLAALAAGLLTKRFAD